MGNEVAIEKQKLEELRFDEKELQKLHKNFSTFDTDGGGTIDPEELAVCEGLRQNPIVNRVVEVLDRNHDGELSFLEFVIGLNSLSVHATPEEKYLFAFHMYDINNDGFISNGDLFDCMKLMVGDNLDDDQLQ